MMEAERGNNSEAGEKEKESPSVESLQSAKESSPLQESSKESSHSSSSGSPDLMDLTTGEVEKSDSAQEVDTEVRSVCF